MAERGPSKSDISAIFKRLRAIPANKVCFDCKANNPTWASVTYGVFICMDCSAVHRSLGVHLTFVRSTQLDTNWTWLQLRAMQVGGNANAVAFFNQHNYNTTDAQQKYNSRTAQLYREKLHQMASATMRIHGTKLFIDGSHSETGSSPEVKEVDFFQEHENSDSVLENGTIYQQPSPKPLAKAALSPVEGPNVEAALSTSVNEATQLQQSSLKGSLGTKKPAGARKGLGAKRGLGAQKVAANFHEIEKEAQRVDEIKEQAAASAQVQKLMSKEEEERRMASMRLAYQDLGLQQKETEQKLRQVDPRKAQQLERLGMGFGALQSHISHSAMSDMKTIQQDSPNVVSSREPEDAFEFLSFTSGPPKYVDSPFFSTKDDDFEFSKKGSWDSERNTSSFSETILPLEKDDITSGRNRKSVPLSSGSSTDEAQKKFGNAKAISSEQFFGGSRDLDFERRTNLARFEGSASISSADYFGDSSTKHTQASYNTPNLYEIKEGVRDGVTKVASKLSSLANGVMSSIQ